MTKSIEERFLEKCGPQLPSGCIEWQAWRLPHGYGMLRLGAATAGRILAHRYAYERANGEIPEGMVVMHTCDNPSCVNAAHLRVGTHRDNTQDMVTKKRHGWRVKTPWQKLNSEDAKAIKQLRQQGFTQQKIADRYGVSRPLISLLLKGELSYSL